MNYKVVGSIQVFIKKNTKTQKKIQKKFRMIVIFYKIIFLFFIYFSSRGSNPPFKGKCDLAFDTEHQKWRLATQILKGEVGGGFLT